jgi:hypothetical protein
MQALTVPQTAKLDACKLQPAYTPDTCFLGVIKAALTALQTVCDVAACCRCWRALPRTDTCLCWQHHCVLPLLVISMLLVLRLLLLLLALLLLPACCEQRLPLCCILHPQLQQALVCQLQQLLAGATLQAGFSTQRVRGRVEPRCRPRGDRMRHMLPAYTRPLGTGATYLQCSSCLGAQAQPRCPRQHIPGRPAFQDRRELRRHGC